jgi:hypothetical protein
MPRTAGVDLENFIITQGPYKGKTVGQVLAIANAVLGGDSISRYGLPASNGCDTLCTILKQINENYEFQGFGAYIDKGYLRPDKSFGVMKPAHIIKQ